MLHINSSYIFSKFNIFPTCLIKKSKVLKIIFLALLFSPLITKAGLLEMPDTTEAPQFERQSLLLDLDIPGVKDRDPDPQSGPHLNVKEFRVQGLTEFPEQGITRAKIIEQVEAIRFDMMGEGKLLSSGYTIDELGKVSDLIAEIEQETKDQHVGPLEVQKLVFLIREQRRQRGITLGMIETVANTITRYYREHGFILAKAYIPKQQVRDGVVTLTVLLGELGEVDVKNNKRYAAKTIQHVFDDSLAKPVTNDSIEEKLFLVNDFPGLSVQGYFEPGTQVGDTKLNVNITSEQWYEATERMDNHGSDRSGKYRAYTELLLHNPLKLGDQLELGVLGTFAPQNSTYGSLRYNIPILSPRIKFSAGISNNDFILGLNSANDLPAEGESKVVDMSVKYQLKRGRVKNYSVGLKVTHIDSKLTFDNGKSPGQDNELQNLEVFYDFDFLNDAKRVLQQGNIAITYSHFIGGDINPDQNINPYIFTVDYSRLSFVQIPFTKAESKLVLHFSGQYSGEYLLASNQFSIAGPTRARGFSVNEFYADDAAVIGADLVFKGPSFNDFKIGGESISSLVQPFVFADVSYGYTNKLESLTATDETLTNIGVGLKFNYKENIRGNLNCAFPISATGTALTGNKKPDTGMNLYFDLQIGF